MRTSFCQITKCLQYIQCDISNRSLTNALGSTELSADHLLHSHKIDNKIKTSARYETGIYELKDQGRISYSFK